MQPFEVVHCPECNTRLQYLPGGYCPGCAVSLDQAFAEKSDSIGDDSDAKENQSEPIFIGNDSDIPHWQNGGPSVHSVGGSAQESFALIGQTPRRNDPFWFLFSFNGRIGRVIFLAPITVVVLIAWMGNMALNTAVQPSFERDHWHSQSRSIYQDDSGRGYGSGFDDRVPDYYRVSFHRPFWAVLVQFVMNLILLWAFLALSAKRFHDLNRSGWWVLMVLIPIAGALSYLLICGLAVGDRHLNRFGPSPQ